MRQLLDRAANLAHDVAALRLLLAAVLTCAVVLAALNPPGWDDPWLRVATILLTFSLASWLSPYLLVSAVALVWLLPAVLYGTTAEIPHDPQPLAELIAFEFLALGWSLVERRLLLGSRVAGERSSAGETAVVSPPRLSQPPTRAATGPGHWTPRGWMPAVEPRLNRLGMNPTDTASLLTWLEQVESDLQLTRGILKRARTEVRNNLRRESLQILRDPA